MKEPKASHPGIWWGIHENVHTPEEPDQEMSETSKDHEMRLRAIEHSLLEHITRCDGRAQRLQWTMWVGFTVLSVLGVLDGAVGKTLIAMAERLR